MSILDKKLFGVVDGNTHDSIDLGQAEMSTLIKRLIGHMQSLSSRGVSSGSFRWSVNSIPIEKHNPAELPADILALIEIETDEQEAERLKNPSPFDIDPMYRKYHSITNATYGDILPEELGQLRAHMRRNYPDYPIKW